MKIDLTKKPIISTGGGISSGLGLAVWYATQGIWDFDIITAKLPNEDKDLYRLHDEVSRIFQRPVIDIWNGKCPSPMDIFTKARFLGNSHKAPCTTHAKQLPMKRYIKANYDPAKVQLALGITYHELDRRLVITKNWAKTGYETVYPLEDIAWGRQEWIQFCYNILGFVPRLYLMGFAHNNCGGACVKAGLYQWVKLLEFLPDVYEEWERGENEFRARFGDYTMLKKGGKPITLSELKADYKAKKEEKAKQMSLWDMDTIPNQYMTQIARFESLDLSEYNDTSACVFCDAMTG